MKDYQAKVQKTIDLEIQMDEQREINRNIESNLSIGEKELKKKTDTLERNLEQLTLFYHQLVSEKSKLSVEAKIRDKKIERLTEKSKKLEESLAKEKSKLSEALKQILNLNNDIDDRNHRMSVWGGNIKKTIQGGGGRTRKTMMPDSINLDGNRTRSTLMFPIMGAISEENKF